MSMWLTRSVRFAHTYRLDVYLLFVLFLASLWRHLPIAWGGITDPRVIVGGSFLCGLVWIYLFNKLCDRTEDTISQPGEMVGGREERLLRRILPVIALAPVVVLFMANLPIWPYLLYIAIGTAYSYPLHRGIRLKNVFIGKTVIAGVNMLSPLWHGLFIYLPPFYEYSYTPNISFLAALFLLYSAGELVWDIRDVAGDRVSRVWTLPVVLGVAWTKVVALGMIAVSVWLLPSIWVNYGAGLVLGGCVLYAAPERPRWFFHAMLYLIGAILITFILWG